MSLKTLVGLLATAVVLAGCASTGGSSTTTVQSLPPPDPAALAGLGQVDYRIGPMDVLDISVFQVPDMTRTVQVDSGGRFLLPLIGSVDAAGRTASEIQADVTAKLSEKYLQSPQVSVTVKEFARQRVTIDGSVTQPGVYPIVGRTTLLQAVALAKGPDRLANEREVVVFRTVKGERMAARFDLAAIRKGDAEDPEVFGDDVIVIDRSGTRGVLREVLGALPLVSVFRPLIF